MLQLKIDDTEALKNFLPLKPFCSDDLRYGLKIAPREKALKAKYIQLNPPHVKKFFTLDIDRPFELYNGSVKEAQKDYGKNFYFAWNASIMPDERRIAPPCWYVQNPKNGHVHFIYVLTTPVYTSALAHIKPLKYLDFIIKSYTSILEADTSYAGLISKNPFNTRVWEIMSPVPPLEQCSYDLEYLAQYIPMKYYEAKPVKIKKGREEISGLGRNCYIMEHCRTWAYRERRNYFQKSSLEWFEAVIAKCNELNNFTPALPQSEVIAIAKSITKWTIKNITQAGFSEWQCQRALLRWSKESAKADGIELFKQGYSVSEVMELLDVSRATAFRYQRATKSLNAISDISPP